jgi:hypothetical protein
MVEIQADEYGGGAPERMHSELFAGLMRSLGLDATYGALWNEAPAAPFASVNTISLFGLHRRWRGAALGHLAAVEMTSSEPSRRYSAGLRRLGFDERVTVFYDEHVEADAVHEQIAAVNMCGSLVAEEHAASTSGWAASESRQMVSRSCGLAATPTSSRPAHSRMISGVVSMWNCSP